MLGRGAERETSYFNALFSFIRPMKCQARTLSVCGCVCALQGFTFSKRVYIPGFVNFFC